MPKHPQNDVAGGRSWRQTPKAIAVFSAAALALSLAACSSSDSSKTSGADTIVEAVPSLTSSYAYDDGDFTNAGFEFLINTNAQLLQNPYVKNKDGDLQQDFYHFTGELASGYEKSSDGLTYTFKLRKGVLSQAGNELTADDVLWSYERKWGAKTSAAAFLSAPAITDPSKQFKKIDKYSFSITIDKAGDGFTLLSLLANASADIYDSTLLKKHITKADPYAVEWSKQNGNYGFGAYNVESQTPGEQLVLVANKNYYAGEPKVKKIIQKVVADAGTRSNLVANGDAGIAVQLRPEDLANLDKNKSAQTFRADSNNYADIMLNLKTGPFKDSAVRTALRYAVPYDQIIKNVYKGRATPMTGFINPNYPGATLDGLEKSSYDPAKAKSILKAAGYSQDIPITLLTSTGVPDAGEVAVQIQTFAADAGFKVKIDNVPAATANENYYGGKYEAYVWREQSVSQTPAYELLLEFAKGSPLNATGWVDQAYYDQVAKGAAIADPLSSTAGAEWAKAQKIWQDAAPTVPIAFVQPSAALSNKVTGYAFRSDNVVDFSVLSAK